MAMQNSIHRNGIGRCVNCGNLFAAGRNTGGELYVMGYDKCRECGSTEFEMLVPEDVGPTD